MSQAHRRGRRPVRRFLLGSGPLKRGTDRVQMLSRVLLLLLVLSAVPVAVVVGAGSAARLAAVGDEQARTRHLARAMLLCDAGTVGTDPATGSPVAQFTDVPATWPTLQGTLRVGDVPALVGSRAGTSVPVWVTADGVLSTAPLDRGAVVGEAAAVGGGTFTGLVLVGWGGYGLVCWRLARRRDRQWTEGWAAVGPMWAARLH